MLGSNVMRFMSRYPIVFALASLVAMPAATAQTKPVAVTTNPMARQELADGLARQGKNKEALEHYLWCFDHGLEHDQAYYGVRLSFLLSDIKDLGEKYPPAIDALRQRIRDVEDAMLAGKGTQQQAHDYGSLCQCLGETKSAVALLKKLNAEGPQNARLCEMIVDPLLSQLLEEKQYEAILSVMGDDPEGWIAREINNARQTIDLMRKRAGASTQEAARVAFVGVEFPLEKLTGYYYALIAAGRRDVAEQLTQSILTLHPSRKAVQQLADAARQAGAPEMADKLRRQATTQPATPATAKAK